MMSQVAVHLNIHQQKKDVIWIETVNQPKQNIKIMHSVPKQVLDWISKAIALEILITLFIRLGQ